MDQIFSLLQDYGYFILFPLSIVEGPILAVIAGFLCANGIMNPWLVYVIIVSGDVVGDSLCYAAGRWGNGARIKKIAGWFGITPEKVDRVRSVFLTNPVKMVALSKIALGIGVVGIYLAGVTRVPYKKMILICLITSGLQYIVYLFIGLFFGSAYKQISHYLNVTAAIFIVVALGVLAFIFIKNIRKKI